MTDKIFIQIDNERIEATGQALEYVLKSQADIQKQVADEQAKREAKEASRTAALAKLKALGLTEAEIAAL
jgi:hypothetical protein